MTRFVHIDYPTEHAGVARFSRGAAAISATVRSFDGARGTATLLLRPFNFNTLATRTQELASLEKLGEAAPAALLVMAVGLVAVIGMARVEARR